MNEEKLQEIENRISEIIENSKQPRGSFMIANDSTTVLKDDIEEYNALIRLKEILNDNRRINGVPFVRVDDVFILESNKKEYFDMLERTNLHISTNTVIDDKEPSINENNNGITEPNQSELQTAIDDEEQSEISNPNESEIEIPENNTNEPVEEIKDDEEQIQNETDIKFIPGLTYNGNKVPWPNRTFESFNNDYDAYEDYLKNFYMDYGIVNDVEYFPGTNIRKPRGKYPHEMINPNPTGEYSETLYTDSYYDDMLNYYANKYKNNPNGTEIIPRDPKDLIPVEPNPVPPTPNPGDDDKEKEEDGDLIRVVETKSADNFFKRHKKALLIAGGLSILSVSLAMPYIIPGIMYANSTVWGAMSGAPAIQGLLHGINNILGGCIGATYTGASGIWTLGSGIALNATAAQSSLLAAIGAQLATVAGLGAVATAITAKVKDMFKKKKNKDNPEKEESLEIDHLKIKKEKIKELCSKIDEINKDTSLTPEEKEKRKRTIYEEIKKLENSEKTNTPKDNTEQPSNENNELSDEELMEKYGIVFEDELDYENNFRLLIEKNNEIKNNPNIEDNEKIRIRKIIKQKMKELNIIINSNSQQNTNENGGRTK